MAKQGGVMRAINRAISGVFPELWDGSFTFVQAADCQLGMDWTMQYWGQPEGALRAIIAKDRTAWTWDEDVKWSEAFVKQVNLLAPLPLFAVMCGDLLDAYPEQFPEIRERQKEDFERIYAALDIPLICVCGNHDVGNSPTRDTVSRYRSDFGDDWFTFVCKGVLFIVLNSQFYEDPQHVEGERAAQDAWLEDQLKLVPAHKHTVVFQHIPWFLNTPDEPKEYFNIAEPLRSGMLEKLHAAGVRAVFTGHYHRNAGGWYKDMELVVTSAVGTQLGPDGHGFRLVRVGEEKVEHEYVQLLGV